MSTRAIAILMLFAASALPAQQARVQGVVTSGAVPVTGCTVTLSPEEMQTRTDGSGHFVLTGVSSGECLLRIHGPNRPSARLDVPLDITSPETTVLVDLVPYYAAARAPFDFDWRLHRSWGNALDDPSDLNSWNSLNERDGTFSGLLLKPVYAAALIGEAVWTPLGFGLGNFVSLMQPASDRSFLCTSALLSGYLPLEGAAKVAEVALRAVLWPVDRAVTWPDRMILDSYREATLAQHTSQEIPIR